MPGVKAILTVDDLPGVAAGAELGENVRASTISERGLTMEPLYEGEPILAVAAVDELTAAEAIEAIQIEYEPLPFAVDPIASLRPGSANARETGNVWMPPTPPAGGAARHAAGHKGAGCAGCRARAVRDGAEGAPSGARGARKVARGAGGAAAAARRRGGAGSRRARGEQARGAGAWRARRRAAVADRRSAS